MLIDTRRCGPPPLDLAPTDGIGSRRASLGKAEALEELAHAVGWGF
jgi:hypothetical protein